jgi:hypothetical protein
MNAPVGGELLDVYLVDQMAAAELMARAMLGDAEAARLFGAFLEAGKRIASAPRRSPVICATCPRRIRRISHDIIFGIAAPERTDRPSAIGFAICPRCAANRAGLLSRASESLRQIWPDLRPIVISHPAGGHA